MCACLCVRLKVVLGQILQNTNACFRFTNSYAVCICILVGSVERQWRRLQRRGGSRVVVRACDTYEKYP